MGYELLYVYRVSEEFLELIDRYGDLQIMTPMSE